MAKRGSMTCVSMPPAPTMADDQQRFRGMYDEWSRHMRWTNVRLLLNVARYHEQVWRDAEPARKNEDRGSRITSVSEIIAAADFGAAVAAEPSLAPGTDAGTADAGAGRTAKQNPLLEEIAKDEPRVEIENCRERPEVNNPDR